MGKNINEYINKFIDSYHNDKNGRYRSYDHCRESFLKYKNDETMYNYITLNLYAYLASWGMLRNSFLMQKDYLLLYLHAYCLFQLIMFMLKIMVL